MSNPIALDGIEQSRALREFAAPEPRLVHPRLFPPDQALTQMQERRRALHGDIESVPVDEQRIRVDSMTRWG